MHCSLSKQEAGSAKNALPFCIAVALRDSMIELAYDIFCLFPAAADETGVALSAPYISFHVS